MNFFKNPKCRGVEIGDLIMTVQAVSMYTVAGVIVMDMEGKRLLAKYYEPAASSATLSTPKLQHTFERTLFTRTAATSGSSSSSNEVAMLSGYVAVYRANLDLIVYVIGSSEQNEMMLSCVLDTFFDVLSELLKPQMDKIAFLENFELVALGLDEIVDRGVILETEPKEVLAKLQKAAAPGSLKSLVDRPLEKQSLSSAFKLAKEQMRSFF